MAEYNERILLNFYKNPTVNIILKEAVTNSIHANASRIKIDLIYDMEKNIFGEKDYKFLSQITITDNGEGFNEKNIKSFLEFGTKNKESLGGKGLGRISFLKLANNVEIESIAKFENDYKKVNFNFTYKINQNDINKEKVKNNIESKTVIKLTELKLKNPNTQLQSVYKSLSEHLKLFLFLQSREKSNNIVIDIYRNGILEEELSSDTIDFIREEKVKIKDIDFSIYMFINNKEKGIHRALCSDNLVVEKEVKKLNSTFYKQYFCAVSSPILNSASDSERENILELNDGTPLKYYKDEIDKIILSKIQEFDDNFKDYNKKSIEKLKTLYGYYNFDSLKEDDLYFDFENEINKKRSEDIQKEDNIVRLLMEKDASLEVLAKEISEQNKQELAKYIFHRDFILQKIEELIINNSAIEQNFHDLLFGKYGNNIWSIDDKFMSYTEAFSDEKISKIKKQIYENYKKTNGDLKEPDITLLYSNETKDGYKDAVICELKAFGINSDRKLVSIVEINRNLGYIVKGIDNINNIWGYIITTLDDLTQTELSMQQGVSKIFTNGETPIYYYYNGNIEDNNGRKVPSHVYVLSPESLVRDGRARNKTFLDILKA